MSLSIVILCGGNGTRLFPLSRNELPKQFLPLTEKEKTMFEITLERAKKIKYNHLFIICNEIHSSLVEEYMKTEKNYTIITEPIGRNTAPAISIVHHLNESKSLLVLSSDHIWDDHLFINSVHQGLEMLENNIVVFGIKPTYPETGYGYIHYKGSNVLSFTEKPKKEVAEKYFKNGNYLWNSGNFLFSKNYLEKELKKWVPEIYNTTKEVLHKSLYSKYKIELEKESFSKVRDDSIDYTIMEKQRNCKVILYDGRWSDIGSFQSLYDFLPKNEDGHVNHHNQSNIISVDSRNSFIHSKKLVSLVGVEDLCIIETDDIIYIGDLKKSQEIKKVVKEYNSLKG